MKVILLTLIVIWQLAMDNSALAMTIIMPHEGETYNVGQMLTVEIQTLPEEDIEKLYILTNNFEGAILDKPPYVYKTVINKPIDGQENISVMALLKNKQTIMLTTYIYAKLPSELELKEIILEEDIVIVNMRPSRSSQGTIRADGVFSDNSQHPINSYSQTRYQSSDESIAKVDSNGVVTGVFPGRTSVKVTAGSISKEIKVKVIYKIDPLKGVTAIALDQSNEIKWEKSPYEGEIVSEYRIYRSKDYEGMGKVLIGTVPADTVSFTDTKPVAGVKYYYSVEAYSQKYNTGSDMEQWVSPVAGLPPAN